MTLKEAIKLQGLASKVRGQGPFCVVCQMGDFFPPIFLISCVWALNIYLFLHQFCMFKQAFICKCNTVTKV